MKKPDYASSDKVKSSGDPAKNEQKASSPADKDKRKKSGRVDKDKRKDLGRVNKGKESKRADKDKSKDSGRADKDKNKDLGRADKDKSKDSGRVEKDKNKRKELGRVDENEQKILNDILKDDKAAKARFAVDFKRLIELFGPETALQFVLARKPSTQLLYSRIAPVQARSTPKNFIETRSRKDQKAALQLLEFLYKISEKIPEEREQFIKLLKEEVVLDFILFNAARNEKGFEDLRDLAKNFFEKRIIKFFAESKKKLIGQLTTKIVTGCLLERVGAIDCLSNMVKENLPEQKNILDTMLLVAKRNEPEIKQAILTAVRFFGKNIVKNKEVWDFVTSSITRDAEQAKVKATGIRTLRVLRDALPEQPIWSNLLICLQHKKFDPFSSHQKVRIAAIETLSVIGSKLPSQKAAWGLLLDAVKNGKDKVCIAAALTLTELRLKGKDNEHREQAFAVVRERL